MGTYDARPDGSGGFEIKRRPGLLQLCIGVPVLLVISAACFVFLGPGLGVVATGLGLVAGAKYFQRR